MSLRLGAKSNTIVCQSAQPDAGRQAFTVMTSFHAVFAPVTRRYTLMILAACSSLVAGCAKSTAAIVPAAPKPVPVQLTPVTYSEVAVPVRATGILSRKTEADLSFKVGGVVEAVLVRAGDAVEPGQVLARLRLDEIEAQVAQAQSALDKAQRDFARVEKLHASAAVSVENLQDARTAVEQSAAQLRIAEFNRRYAVITAPSAGRILRRTAEPDELVPAGKAILGFASNADGWLVRAGLAERDIAHVRLGDRAEVAACNGNGAPTSGRVTQISEAVDPATRTTQIEIALDAMPCAARSGVVVAVTVQPQPVAARPVVPATALIEGTAGAASLFVVDEGAHASRRMTVEVEALLDAQAYLRTALPRAAHIVASGAEYLRDGTLVEAVK